MDTIGPAELRKLISAETDSCISIYVPTNVNGAAAEQDPARLRDMLNQAEGELTSRGMNARIARMLLEPARKLVRDEIFWRERSSTLAMFIADGGVSAYRLPISAGERLVVGKRFYVKPLLEIDAGNGRFYVLALSENKVRLLEGNRYGMQDVDLPDLPTNLQESLNHYQADRGAQVHSGGQVRQAGAAPARKGAAVFHGQGGVKDTAKNDLDAVLSPGRCLAGQIAQPAEDPALVGRRRKAAADLPRDLLIPPSRRAKLAGQLRLPRGDSVARAGVAVDARHARSREKRIIG